MPPSFALLTTSLVAPSGFKGLGLTAVRIVRVSSWRDKTTILGEWRGCNYERGMVVKFLEDLVGIMGCVVDGGVVEQRAPS